MAKFNWLKIIIIGISQSQKCHFDFDSDKSPNRANLKLKLKWENQAKGSSKRNYWKKFTHVGGHSESQVKISKIFLSINAQLLFFLILKHKTETSSIKFSFSLFLRPIVTKKFHTFFDPLIFVN